MNKIIFASIDRKIDLKYRLKCKSNIKDIFKHEGFRLKQIVYIFCSDSYLLDINRKYLKHDYFTDVITFPLSAFNKPVEGEVYISSDRVSENAKKYAVSYQNELLRVIIHGALHLCGYDDKTVSLQKQMQSREQYYLNLF